MQTNLNIPTHDHKLIYGILETPQDSSKGLIIFIHGLTGSLEEHIHANGAKFFTDKGYTTYRCNLYGPQEDARKLEETSLQEHIHDVNTILDYFQKQGSQKMFLIGHSLGGLVILYSNHQNISAITLRDPSIGGDILLEDIFYDKEAQGHRISRGNKEKIGKQMYQDFLIPKEQHVDQIHKIHIPIKIISAGKSSLQETGKQYYLSANEPKEYCIVAGATHCFDEEGTEEKLFQETYSRIQKHT